MAHKELTINGDLYAYYELEGDLLYLKMLIEINEGNSHDSENLLIAIIQGIEKTEIKGAAYLNV